ncbi:MAG: SDR family oxidoreductase [Bacteroidales bacterium]
MKQDPEHKKTVVITGSTKGIGHGLALHLLERGHQVMINGRDHDRVAQRVREMRDHNFEVEGVAGDVSLPDTHLLIIEQAVSRFRKIDIWINNAGVPQSYKYFHELDNDEIECLVSVNIFGTMTGTKAAINLFKQQGYGKIFNLEGLGSDGRIMEKLTLYGTSKRAVHYFTKSVARELRGENIQAGILSPGMVRTDFISDPMKDGNPEELARFEKVRDILAEDPEKVTEFLVKKILASRKQYDRIEYLTFRRMVPKILRLMSVR